MGLKAEKEMEEWLDKAGSGSKEGIENSSVFSSIVTKGYLDSPLCALQLGYAILMDKPIFLIVDKDLKIPESLVKVAKAIERFDPKKSQDQEMGRISKLLGEFAKQYGANQ